MGRPKKQKDPPKWQTGVDSMSPWFAFVLAPLVQPWGLIAAGAAVIIDAKLGSWQSALAFVYFLLLSVGTYLAVEIYALARPERTRELIASVRAWIADHTDQVIIIISLVARRLADRRQRLPAGHLSRAVPGPASGRGGAAAAGRSPGAPSSWTCSVQAVPDQ